MVLGVHNQTVSLVVVAVSVFAYFSVKHSLNYPKDYTDNQNENNLLLIAITSAQENFIHRQAIRNTWAKLIDNENLKYYFLIGKKICPIPPQYRISKLSCEEWKPHINKNVNEENIFSVITRHKCCKRGRFNANRGFTFILNHDIILHQFGIKSSLLLNCNKPIKLVLLDAITQIKIASSSFVYSTRNNEDIIWKRILKTTLPSGFEGNLTIEGGCNFENEEENINKISFALHDSSNIIRFLQIFTGVNTTKVFKDDMSTNFGFTFSVKNVSYIHKLLANREAEWERWKNHVQDKSAALENEVDKHNDILLFDFIDVYHNLPLKMLLFYKWLNKNDKFKNYEYILKTDDDVFIDIPKVIKELEIKYGSKNKWNWWSCFRTNWPVQRAGKWRELNLKLTSYPTFPSGAGYVLDRTVLKYMNNNFKKMYTNVQGEDVAIGLWLSDFKPKMHVGSFCNWSCDNICLKNNCNIMQLNETAMYDYWQRYLSCNYNLCWCK